MRRILLVSEEKRYLTELADLLATTEQVTRIGTVEAALSALENNEYDVLFLPCVESTVMRTILELGERKGGVAVVYSSQGEPEAAVRVMRLGAQEYIDARRHPPREVADKLELLATTGSLSHIKGLQEEQRRLQHEARQFRMLFDNMLNGFAYHRMILDDTGEPVDFVFLQANPAFEEMTGLNRKEILGKAISETQPGFTPHDSEWLKAYGEVAVTGKSRHFERYSENLGRWLEVNAYSPEPLHFATVFQDITERKEQEQEMRSSINRKTTLLREIHHRVKNNMQVVASLLNLQLGYADVTPRIALERSQERIQSMALIHELLYRSADLNHVELLDYIRQIGGAMVTGLHRNIPLIIEGTEVSIPGEQAFSVGLMATEAISNAIIHGGSGEEDPITLRVEPEERGVTVTIEDQGPGFDPETDLSASSLGFTLIREMATQIKGSVTVKRGAGTKVILSFPRSGRWRDSTD